MKFPDLLQLLLKKLLEWKFQAWSLVILTTLASVFQLAERHLIALIPNPKELWAAKLAEVNILLLALMVIAYIWYRNKHIAPQPDLSKKTELQDKIINTLTIPATSQELSKILGKAESLILYNLELLEAKLLVHSGSYNSPSWRLSKHGRKYLYAETA